MGFRDLILRRAITNAFRSYFKTTLSLEEKSSHLDS